MRATVGVFHTQPREQQVMTPNLESCLWIVHEGQTGLRNGPYMYWQSHPSTFPLHESGYDRSCSDCMVTFTFGWGKTDMQQQFRNSELNWRECAAQ